MKTPLVSIMLLAPSLALAADTPAEVGLLTVVAAFAGGADEGA